MYGIGQILPRIFHYLVFSTYLTYRLSESRAEYAIYLDLYAYASVLIVIFSYRMDTAFFRFGRNLEEMDSVYKTAFLPMIGTSIILVLLGCTSAATVANWLTYPGRGYYVVWFSIIVALDVLALLPMARLRLQSRAKLFVTFKVINVAVTISLVMLFLEIIPRYDASLLQRIIPFAQSDIDFVFFSNMVASGLMLTGLLFIYPIRLSRVDWTLWKRMVHYAWPLIIVGIAGSINQFFGVPLQKYFLGVNFEINKDEAAIYGAVQKIPALLAMFTTAYNYAAEPFFFKNTEHKDHKILYGDIALFFIMVAGILVLAIYLYIDVFQYFIGPTFRDGLYLIPILLISYLFLGIYYNVSIWYKLSDNTMYGALIATVGAIITIVGSIIFLPKIGVIASAYAALACYFVMVLLALIIGRKKYPINYPLVSMSRIIALIIAIMMIGAFFRNDSLANNLIYGSILIILYFVLCYQLEKKRIKSYF